jgi:hypothetical protein
MSKQNSSKSDKIKRSQELYINALATSTNYSKTCEEIGLCKDTFYRWLRENPEFREKLDAMRTEMCQKAFDDAVCFLKNAMTKAVETLISLLDRQDFPAVQRASANDILAHIQRFKEFHDHEERLRALEERGGE